MSINKNVPGFPDNWGQHRVPIIEHPGPASYVSGGEVIQGGGAWPASFAFVLGGLTYSGTYRVECIYPGAGIRTSVGLKWTVASTGEEVSQGTNLSAEKVRLLVVGG